MSSFKNNDISLELLAPAGNKEIGKAAIDHGADAVYIGAPKFSARKNAGNSLDDISELIDYAHLFNARVYLTLNTILTDSEIPDAINIIKQAYQAKADGVIIQDMGLVQAELPPIPLIASTQMNNTTPEKVKFLEDIGFSRVILARELNLSEIRQIRAETSVELEYFVHGALCVCYSGQCYLSQAAFGRSANRGACAQPCRLKYTLKDGKGNDIVLNKHLLSLKDLSLIEYIKDLAEAGVSSFKIEGRYKEIGYVKNVVAAYRAAIDTFIREHKGFKKQSSGNIELKFTPDIHKTFNRGYTDYFISGSKEAKSQAAIDSPKSIGAKVGRITHTDKKSFKIKGVALHNGDGLCFISKTGVLKGFRVERVQEDESIIPNDMQGLSVGVELFRNHDHQFLKLLDKQSADRKIDISMKFSQTDGEINLAVTDEDGYTINSALPSDYEEPKHPEKIKEMIYSQLTSTGNTTFKVKEFLIDANNLQPGFLPKSIINSLRRNALDELTLLRLKSYRVQAGVDISNKSEIPIYPEKELYYQANVLNKDAEKFYETHGTRVVEYAFETGLSSSDKILMTTKYCIRRELGACLKTDMNRDRNKKLNIEPPLTLTDGTRSYKLKFDCQQCKMYVIGSK